MNRIILIGNGFDLAHGMKTSYQDFITYLWNKFINEVRNSKPNKPFENDEIKINRVPSSLRPDHTYASFTASLSSSSCHLTFKNRFLEAITSFSHLNNWVDIENEYYRLLKRSYQNTTDNYSIEQLNNDFERIKKYLAEYLLIIEDTFKANFENSSLKSTIGRKIFAPFDLKDFTEESVNKKISFEYERLRDYVESLEQGKITFDDIEPSNHAIVGMLLHTDHRKKLKNVLLSETSSNYFDMWPDQILFLNFNYTSTEDIYKDEKYYDTYDTKRKISCLTNHIHGSLKSADSNPIIFGFGDEIDEDYKHIERLNDNKYLDNIKSINYLETSNYKRLLEFLNSGSYQIFLIGHSCGLSDRTLLNTLFENKNCVSIKPFYFKREDRDNYSEIVRNVSRNFNNKSVMRDKVVNKKYCTPIS